MIKYNITCMYRGGSVIVIVITNKNNYIKWVI